MGQDITGRVDSTFAQRLLPTPDAYQGSRGGSQHPVKRRRGGIA